MQRSIGGRLARVMIFLDQIVDSFQNRVYIGCQLLNFFRNFCLVHFVISIYIENRTQISVNFINKLFELVQFVIYFCVFAENKICSLKVFGIVVGGKNT